MELVYTIDTITNKATKECVAEEKPCASLSCRNVLALTKLSDTGGSSPYSQKYDIVVLDLDKPWEPFRVTTVTAQIIHLEWNVTGNKLLVIDAHGTCKVWTMKNHLLNVWECIGTMKTAGEEILSVMWFQNGLQLIFDPDKRDKTQYIEKFVRNSRCGHPLTQFGGSRVEGWMLITASGLISVGVSLNDNDVITATENLSASHMRLTTADIANTGNGEIMVAVSDGQLSSAIQCYSIRLKLTGRNVKIACSTSASFYMKTQLDYGNSDAPSMRITKVMFMNQDSSDTLFVCCGSPSYSNLEVWQHLEQMMNYRKAMMTTDEDGAIVSDCLDAFVGHIEFCGITKVMFMNQDSSDTLFVCCGSPSYSNLEVWQHLEQMMPLHKMFSMNTAPDTSNKTHKWMHKATISHASLCTSLAGPKLPMTRNVVETSGFAPYIVTSYKDGMIQLVHRYTFQVICTSNIDTLCQTIPQTLPLGEKKLRLSQQLSSVIQTGSGCGILGISGGKIYLFRVYNSSRDSTMQLSPSMIVLMLEYAMITGQDWWDIFLAVRQGMIMNICQALSDNFSKQTYNMNDYMFMRLLSMKMGLFSSYSAGHQKAVDYHTRLVLHSIGNVIKGILKPRTVTSQEKSPSEKVMLLCSKNTDGDIDNILANLDVEEFHVDVKKKDKPDASLYSLQPLIQWVSDFCLQLLSSVPLFQSFSSFMGSTLLNDASVLNLLRELIVIFKAWGVIYPGCTPVFTTMSVSLDLLKHMFKLLTRAWMGCKEGRTVDFDDTLLDECSVLPSKVLIPNLSQSFRMDGNGFTVFTQQIPLTFEFNQTPEYLYQKQMTKTQRGIGDFSVSTVQQNDIVRQIYLGTKPSGEIRQCSRCGCLSILGSIGKSQAMKSWEERWARNCLCMGHWKLNEEK